METYTLDNFPPNVGTVHVAYFENVTNAREIRHRLVAAATAEGPEGEAARAAIDFGFVEAGLVSMSKRRRVRVFRERGGQDSMAWDWVPHPEEEGWPRAETERTD
jgi:hypothetical protein